jgi:hypothetical protein
MRQRDEHFCDFGSHLSNLHLGRNIDVESRRKSKVQAYEIIAVLAPIWCNLLLIPLMNFVRAPYGWTRRRLFTKV